MDVADRWNDTRLPHYVFVWGIELELRPIYQRDVLQLKVAKENAMIVLALAALFGGVATAIWMADYGAIAVILSMPLGGSLAAIAAAIPLGVRNKATKREREALTLPELTHLHS